MLSIIVSSVYIKTSQVIPTIKLSGFYSENKLVKQDTNFQNALEHISSGCSSTDTLYVIKLFLAEIRHFYVNNYSGFV